MSIKQTVNRAGTPNYLPTPQSSGGALSRDVATSYAADGAIQPFNTVAILSKAGVGAYTLVAPLAIQNGQSMRIVSSTAQAHVITFAAGKINGGALVTATFGGAIGDGLEIIAFNTVWYTVGGPRNVTIA
ncbi:MAG TPA: hypothetical protein VFC02_09745 [Anaerolineales bacterium]|nr:hypothetical protein [Anaerolineales bacterium]